MHPHLASSPDDRARWDSDVANFNADLRTTESFFLDMIAGRLADPDSIRARAMAFFGVQGPWFTVGWKMAAIVERALGRQALLDDLCDMRDLLVDYNEVVSAGTEKPPRLWSAELLAALGVGSPNGS